MRPLLLVLFTFLYAPAARTQSTINFNSGVPVNWSCTGSTTLTISDEHYKGGNYALKWEASAGDTLIATDLGISASAISSSSHFYIYSSSITDDTLFIQFIDGSGVVQREGHMLLNYQGWRSYHRNLKTDYNYGNELPAFAPEEFRMIYKPSGNSGTHSIYIDEVDFVGFGEARSPGPHLLLDYLHFAPNQEDSPAGNGLRHWLNTPDIPVTTASATELNDLALVRGDYARSPGTATAAEVQEAKDFVDGCTISRNPDNSIKGRPLTAVTIYYPDSLVMLSRYVGFLARAWLNDMDTDARDALRLFTEYLLDQGLAEGGRIIMLTNSYDNALDFPVGFLEALPVYTTAMREEVIRMLKWSNEYNKIYAAEITPGLNVDYLYLKTPFLFELACADTSDNRAVRDLKCLSRFLGQNARIGEGGRDGIKADGTGFHHHSHLVSYLHAYNTWIDAAYSLKGTAFHISQPAYDTMSFAIKSLFLEASLGKIFANAECGRRPFQSSIPVDSSEFIKLVATGGDLAGTSFDTGMAAVYNYMYQSGYYPVTAASLDGFHQFNYAQMGVFKKNSWTAVMRGFTDKLFGTEIFAAENRYGRYQSYGSVEILYQGQLTATGYRKNGEGWDWNTVPGATTVQLPYDDLNPIPDKFEEYQLDHFAGALSMGSYGIFGMRFRQDTAAAHYNSSELEFRKSVFAFDSILICMGTGIHTGNSDGNVTTNLFQAIVDSVTTNPAIYINSTTAVSGNYNSTVPIDSAGYWLSTAQGTGFFIPAGNDSLAVYRGSQVTPRYTSVDGADQVTAHVSKAWLSHGSGPDSGRYQFVIVPEASADKMQELSPKLANHYIYQTLQQDNQLHAVRYIPGQTNSYACFEAISGIAQGGFVKSISAPALLGVQEKGDTLVVQIDDPDLHTVDESTSYWRSTASTVTITLDREWEVLENNSSASIVQQGDSLTATFTLVHGNAAKLVLLNPNAIPQQPGTWVLQEGSWNYSIGVGSKGDTAFTTAPGWSVSPGTRSDDNFQDAPVAGYVRIGAGSTGTPRFDLVDSARQLQIACSSTANIGRFSGYDMDSATSVTSFFLDISFNDSSTTNKVEWTFATGYWNDTATYFSGASGIPSHGSSTSTPFVFGAVKWQILPEAPEKIHFLCRQKTTTTNNIFTELNDAFFQRGQSYRMEFYCNNSDTLQHYVRGITTYTVLPQTYHVWANDQHLNFEDAAGFPANELPVNNTLNAFLVEGKNAGSLVSGVQTSDNSALLTIGNSVRAGFGQVATPTAARVITRPSVSGVSPASNSFAQVAPNPATQILGLHYNATIAKKTTINIYNMNGQLVHSTSAILQEGVNTLQLDVHDLSAGIYTIVIDKNALQFVKK